MKESSPLTRTGWTVAVLLALATLLLSGMVAMEAGYQMCREDMRLQGSREAHEVGRQ